MKTEARKSAPSFVEFVVIISLMMSLTALSIDAMLPSLGKISSDLGVTNPNDRQLVISIIFLGQAVGQLFFGPLSDKTGRKPALYAGYALFIAGALISALAASFPMLLVGRALQGVGISSPRAVSLALVRDQYEGSQMARLMSFAMTVFILVPTIAPSFGQAILLFAGWRAIFVSYIVVAIITVIWFGLRLPETLAEENRKPFSLKQIVNSTVEILKIRPALGYTLVSGLVSGAFLGYLNSSQQIFQEQYALGELFSIIFAIISLALGAASFINARLVMRYEMDQLVHWTVRIVFGLAATFLVVIVLFGQPPLWGLMVYLMLYFFCTGIMFGNINTLAMQPLGHLAGTGSAVIGSISTFISMMLGTLIGQMYNGTIFPLVAGMAILTGISIFGVSWSEKEQPPVLPVV